MKQNPIQEVQGQLFGMSQSKANKWIERTRNEFRVNVARDKRFWVQGTLRPW